MILNISTATKEEFENLDYFYPTNEFNGVVIIPTNELHDSGYGCMKFALTNNGKVVGCVGGYSDVIHLNGIGGNDKFGLEIEARVKWRIDCLPCGLIRLFCSRNLSIEDTIYSDFILCVK